MTVCQNRSFNGSDPFRRNGSSSLVMHTDLEYIHSVHDAHAEGETGAMLHVSAPCCMSQLQI